ncbi:MAG: ferric uptake regulator family protein [Desulfobacterales bacterium]|nr:MAG: ferric uptake regulator family protein [Desulfobacterales bacterium]
MCIHCNYRDLMKQAGLPPNPNRLKVMEIIGNNNFPLSATQIHDTLDRQSPVNRVTVYRILDLLVEKGLVDRIATGGRSAYYGLAPNDIHPSHAHFYCTQCGKMDCLSPESLNVELNRRDHHFPGKIDRMEMRLDGVCTNCLKKSSN